MITATVDRRPKAVRTTLSVFRTGAGDPTTRLDASEFWRATHTPLGPGTVRIRFGGARLEATAWGDGAPWLLERAEWMAGVHDRPEPLPDLHPAVTAAQRNYPDLRLGASGTLYHELLPAILGQRITAREATFQWHTMVRRLGEPAPGPMPLLLPPEPARLASMPSWWFHPLGIEAKRANSLRIVARHADKLWHWATLPAAECATKLAMLPGVGEWTVGMVLGPALGNADAIAVGDYHLKNVVAVALTGRPRGTDEEMVELLEPYRPQRGRVTRLLGLDGHRPAKFGPRQRILPMHRW